jgi:hypothetical protein
MTGPIAYTVHDGHSRLPNWRRQLIAAWLTANDIEPGDVSADHAISVLTVPFRPEETAGGGPWQVQVIVLHQYYTRPDGTKEQNLITRKAVTFQRTVPLKTPFPADPTTADEGTRHGEAEGQAAQEAPEEVVRPARSAPVPDRHEGEGPERSGAGRAERVEGNPEDHPFEGHEAVAQPEEVRWQPQEEVGGV